MHVELELPAFNTATPADLYDLGMLYEMDDEDVETRDDSYFYDDENDDDDDTPY